MVLAASKISQSKRTDGDFLVGGAFCVFCFALIFISSRFRNFFSLCSRSRNALHIHAISFRSIRFRCIIFSHFLGISCSLYLSLSLLPTVALMFSFHITNYKCTLKHCCNFAMYSLRYYIRTLDSFHKPLKQKLNHAIINNKEREDLS